jgi:hypothetical protein
MQLRERFIRSNFFIKLRSWEYWPFGIIQLPLFVYFGWLSLRARSLIFFSASNPGIAMGGMFGESKFEVLQKVPEQYVPKTILISIPVSKETVIERLKQHRFRLPVIFKPDLGERGYMVTRIETASDIEAYLAKSKIDFLVQELIDLPLEYGIFYTRFPNKAKGAVTSIVMKEMLTVVGDGKSTLRQLFSTRIVRNFNGKNLRADVC